MPLEITPEMEHYREVLIYVVGFICVLFASDYFGKYLQKLKLPLITGFLILGIILGPQVVGLIKPEAIPNLTFINDLSLAFIAFAAGAELYLKEIRGRIKSIIWNTIGQIVITFGVSAIAVFYLSEHIQFMKDMPVYGKAAVSLLMASIFVARSPSSAIAVINEMRAKGPFTQTAIGVTVIIDVLVVILFTIAFSVASTIIHGHSYDVKAVIILIIELLCSLGFGYLLGKFILGMLEVTRNDFLKAILLLIMGYIVFFLSHLIPGYTEEYLGTSMHYEPLLVCLTASFIVTNRSKRRGEYQAVIHKIGPFIYVSFFTLTGVMMSIDLLISIWEIALVLFFVRLISLIAGSFIGSTIARDDKQHRNLGWMPYVTQAGVGLGLAIEVSSEFDAWGEEFATIVIAVIVLNQLLGPPLFKWALNLVKESHTKAEPGYDGIRDAIIFGLEGSSISLARQLKAHGWDSKVVTIRPDGQNMAEDIDIYYIDQINKENLDNLDAKKSESIILMLSDDENYKLCEVIYEHFGTPNVVVRLHPHRRRPG